MIDKGYFRTACLALPALGTGPAFAAEPVTIDGLWSVTVYNAKGYFEAPASAISVNNLRLYRPRPEILDGRWQFPEPTPIR